MKKGEIWIPVRRGGREWQKRGLLWFRNSRCYGDWGVFFFVFWRKMV